MKKKIVISSCFLLICIILSFFIYTKTNKEYIINKTLKNKYYNYLPKEAKSYIKKVYEQTGEIIDTEKNKQENIPYLSPKYVEYLALSKEKQKNVAEIPKQYDIYFDSAQTNNELPAKYDLRNINGNSYITPLKNQSTLNLCWDFTSIEQAESNLMVKNNQPYTDSTIKFSTRQIDYASSTDGIKDYYNENGTRTLTSGGNFLVSSLILYNGLGLYNNSIMPFNTSNSQKEAAEVLNYNSALYELNSSVMMPTMDTDNTPTEWENYKNILKQLIIENGGAYVGTQAPGYSCSSNNPKDNNATTIIRVDGICEEDGNHAMQIIGWDDNYEYSYCQSKCLDTSSHPTVSCHSNNVSSCNASDLVEGKGAWLLRNSWGNSDSYIYLAYDSLRDDVYILQDFSSNENKTWDNNYHKTMDPVYITLPTTDTQIFHKGNNSEKLEKIKLFTYGKNGKYSISITSDTENYDNVKQVTIPDMGITTIDLSAENIILTDEDFTVTIKSNNNVRLMEKSMSIFTSNVSKEPVIQTERQQIDLDLSTSDYSFRILSKTKNIPSGETINYSLKDNKGTDESNYLTAQNNIVAANDVNTLINISSAIQPGYHTLTISYQNTSEDIDITIGENKVYIYFYANDGGSGKITQSAALLDSVNLRTNQFTRTGYTFDSWNTKADGSGDRYEDQQYIENIKGDLNLYAQWIPNKYTITFDSNGGEGEMESQEFTTGTPLQLQTNLFTKEGYIFKGWNTKADGTGNIYVANQIINILTKNIVLYAQWERKPVRIYYNSNGGQGAMNQQETVYEGSLKIKINNFTKSGYTFKEWNTKADGTGQSYTENQMLNNITEDIILYAQWTPNKYKIIFNANGGQGTMEPQEFTYNQEQQLTENSFTHQEYQFVSWNTKKDGTGIFYQNTQSIINLTPINNKQITLYAMWNKIPDVYYKTHVQSYGWQDYVSNGNMSGTTGEAKRLEAIKIKILNQAYAGGIEYRTHIQSYGWENSFKQNDQMSGTSGEGKRLEAIEIRLTGDLANHYDIYYRVHAQHFGWLGWARNGEAAGTAGYAYRLEGIEIKLVEKDSVFASYGQKEAFEEIKILYTTHVQSYGWQEYAHDGEMSGTSGEAKRLEAIKISLNTQKYSGEVLYKTHIQSYGWEPTFKRNGELSGTEGEAKRLEAIQIKLTGEIANHYDIYYRVHAQHFGWMNWAKNGESAGTSGFAYRLEGIEIILVSKDGQPPVRDNQNNTKAFISS